MVPLGMILYTSYTFGEQFTTITTEAPGAAKHIPRQRMVPPQQMPIIPKDQLLQHREGLLYSQPISHLPSSHYVPPLIKHLGKKLAFTFNVLIS